MRTLALAALALSLIAAPVRAETPKPEAILKRMKSWLEPDRPSTRRLTMSVRSAPGDSAQWQAGQARATLDGSHWVLTVLLEPKDLRGAALLVQERDGKTANEWLFLPYLRRVRKMLPVNEFESFLNTEFTYSDLGFVNLDGRTVTLLGEETLNGIAAYKLQEVPARTDYFTRIVTWVAKDSGQPLKREYYDPADRLWKVETFESVADIHGVPTAQRVRMEDAQTGFGSEYRAGQIGYDVALPKELFDPAQLPNAAAHAIWK
jgi:hypothetical protein